MSLGAALFVLLLGSVQALERETYEVYLCALHPDEQATKPGRCPVCDRDLVLRTLVPSFSCPMHPGIDEEREGRCPVCKMNLVATTREAQWICPGRPDVLSSTPALCPDGSPMEMKSVAMAHGDHNPRHGGILFMAPNGYHHLEGTLAEDGSFRLYLYNDFTRPIPVNGFEGRVGGERMVPAADETYLALALGGATEVVLYLRFPGEEGQEARFDFIFTAEAGASPILSEFRIPETADEIYREILERNERVSELIRKGAWPDLYIPALEAKDLVLALQAKEGERIAIPAKKLVRAAWLLDTHGDRGNRLEVEAAHRLFERAVDELERAHGR